MVEPRRVMSSLAQAVVQGAAICHAAVSSHGDVLAGLFVAGLVGSAGHCAGMCGPFVLTQVGARLEAVPASAMGEWHRLVGAALVPYHLGRATTYMILGACVAGAVGHLAGGGTVFTGLAAAALGLAALLMLGVAFPRLVPSVGGVPAVWIGAVTGLARPLFDRPLGWRGMVLGMVLGFIPCGLLYAALAASAAMGSALGGALGMAAFTAGTVPMLVAIGVAGHVASGVWRGAASRLAPWLLMANGLVLAVLSARLIWTLALGV